MQIIFYKITIVVCIFMIYIVYFLHCHENQTKNISLTSKTLWRWLFDSWMFISNFQFKRHKVNICKKIIKTIDIKKLHKNAYKNCIDLLEIFKIYFINLPSFKYKWIIIKTMLKKSFLKMRTYKYSFGVHN